MILLIPWEGYQPVPVDLPLDFSFGSFTILEEKGGDSVTEDLLYIIFMLWNLTDGFNLPFVNEIITSAYTRFFDRYR